MQDKPKKGISTHVKEIQAFEKYFETAHILDYLSRTIREAAITLKEKFLNKIEDLKLPLFVKPEQWYRLAFSMHPPKFPRLHSAEFGVAFSSLLQIGLSVEIL